MAAATMTIMKRRAMEAEQREAERERQEAKGVAPKLEAEEEEEEYSEPEEEYRGSLCARCFNGLLDLINGMALQTILYLTFVVIFQALTGTMRSREEFYLCALPHAVSTAT